MQSSRSRSTLICASLAAAVVVAFWSVRGHAFISLDDGEYVFQNPHVARGLTWASLGWAFRSMEAQNWHPLTWLSHMLDVELFGVSAGPHHLVNVALHAANAILLFLAMARMTRAPWRSAFAAFLFALHPLHVESVAWIAERKDLLSTSFGLLAIHGYVRYAQRGDRTSYVASWVAAGMSLMAKPMLVTLPAVLLLLDLWPLDRLGSGAASRGAERLASWRRAVLEKVPFALLSLGSAIVTYVAQQRGGAVVHQDVLPLAARMANAAIAYATYVLKTLWPADLAIYYPHPASGHPAWKVLAAGLALAVVSVLLLRGSRRYPYLATGWLWFLGTLVPVIGIVQVGGQAYADRYTYVPSIGLYIVLIWGGHDLLAAAWPRERMRWMAAPAIAIILVLGSSTRAQTAHWRDTRAVFGHALSVTSENWMAHTNLGKAAFDEGRVDEAIDRFGEALRLRPRSHVCLTNLGTALARGGNVRGAEQLFRGAIATEASYANAWYNLGVALVDQGRPSEAVEILQTAVRLVPGDGRSRKVLAAALLGTGQPDGASAQYREALRIDDHDVEATAGLGVALAQGGHLDDAILAFRRAVSLDPHDPILRQNLETALAARAGHR